LSRLSLRLSGLSHAEAGKLENFLHFAKPKKLKKKLIQEQTDLDPSIDFLDPLSDDVPKGDATHRPTHAQTRAHTNTICIYI
jgi:hypothetical protein